jgi:hypothetical protein
LLAEWRKPPRQRKADTDPQPPVGAAVSIHDFTISSDTDVASLSYKGRLPTALAVQLVGQEVLRHLCDRRELSRWAEKARWGTRARTELVDWLGRTVVLPYDERVAWRWGQLTVEAEGLDSITARRLGRCGPGQGPERE